MHDDERRKRLDQALGKEKADLVLKNCRLVNVLSGEIEENAEIAIGGERVVGVGTGYDGRRIVDCGGRYAYPGLIDAHIHLESTKLCIPEAARLFSRFGTTAVVADPHEIANVAGIDGILFQCECARRNRFIDVYFAAPSCVPAICDEAIETPGAVLGADALALLAHDARFVALGEMMNVPGVVTGDEETHEKIARFIRMGKVADGHAPMVSGRELNAYIWSGIGSDHESTGAEEAREKLRRGMAVMIREGSSERNLEALLPLIDKCGRNASRLMFASDDLDPSDLFSRGHINHMVSRAVAAGVDPILALQMATLSPARYFGLDRDMGAIAPGMYANIAVSPDLTDFIPDYVLHRGEICYEFGRSDAAPAALPHLRPTMNALLPRAEDLRVPHEAGKRLRVIELAEHQIVTRERFAEPSVADGCVVLPPDGDIAKVCVFERHRASGAFGMGFVRGLGIKRGAMGSSVAHDAHHLIVVGACDDEILRCARRIIEMGGGQAAVCGDRSAELPLPVAGLMSDARAEDVCRAEARLASFCRDELGVTNKSPFAAMSFMALPVIPEIRVTDRGLWHIEAGGYPQRADILA